MKNGLVAKLFLIGLLSTLHGVASAQAPVAPPVSDGNYSVSFNVLSGATVVLLEERIGASGTWTTVTTNFATPSGVFAFSNKPSGIYYYRKADIFIDLNSGGGTYYSDEIQVVVTNGPIPEPDTVTDQLDYTYEVRQGDINGDNRLDLFVDRTSGGTAGNGTLETIILQRLANGTFTPIVPSAAQQATASSWPIAAADLILRDFDLDGFVDIVLQRVTGAVGQIILSSGQIFGSTPKGVIPMDSKFNDFMQETSQWVSNPNYYEENVPYVPVTYYQWVPYCYWTWDGYYCTWILVYWTVNEPDYSVFDPDALSMRNVFTRIVDGLLSPDLIPGSPEAVLLGEILDRVFGTDIFGGILGQPCSTVLAYDDDYDVPCNDTSLIGQILLSNFVGWSTGDGDYRLLTSGEKADAAGEGLSIRNVNLVRVYNRGLRIFFRIDSQIMSPNGHVYIGTDNVVNVAWSEDYSMESVRDEGVLIHELTHVYQVRTEGCHIVCMGLRKLGSILGRGYDYYPFDPGRTFDDHNMEQQAEMVGDRFRFRRGLTSPFNFSLNGGVTQADLEAIIPF